MAHTHASTVYTVYTADFDGFGEFGEKTDNSHDK